MIDFSKIHFEERPHKYSPYLRTVRANLILSVEKNLNDYSHLADYVETFLKKELLKELHHKVYGELYRPIAELIELALWTSDPANGNRVEQLRDEIFALLKRP